MTTEDQHGNDESANPVEKRIDFETELGLQFIEMNGQDFDQKPYNTIKQMKQFLLSK